MAQALRGSFRRVAVALAFRPHQPGAPRDVARHCRGPGGCRGRRTVRAVPAVRRSRPDRGRRRARQFVQAGRRRRLQCARHGRGAGSSGIGAHRARVGDALAGERRQREDRPLRRSAPAGTSRRPSARGPVGGRSATRAAAARPLAVAAGRRGDEADAGGGRADPAVPQSPWLCADHPVPRLRPGARMPAMFSLACRASLSPHPGLPSLRLLRAAGPDLPPLRRGRSVRGLRSRRRAAGRGSARTLSRGAAGTPTV